jgi:ABC-type glutathione transport system ATPase component
MISVRGLTKRYGDVRAVDDLTFDVEAGKVTGFLGPNGAGKSTTMRIVMGLDGSTAGTTTVNGKRYVDFGAALRRAGQRPRPRRSTPTSPSPRAASTTTARRPHTRTEPADEHHHGSGPHRHGRLLAQLPYGWSTTSLLAGGWRLLRADANR